MTVDEIKEELENKFGEEEINRKSIKSCIYNKELYKRVGKGRFKLIGDEDSKGNSMSNV